MGEMRVMMRMLLASAVLLLAGGAFGAEGSGDLNGNGRLDANDLRGLNALCMKKPADHKISCAPADLDGSGRIDSKDWFDELRPTLKEKGLTRESPEVQLVLNCNKKKVDAELSCSAVDMTGDGLVAPNDFFILRGKVNEAEAAREAKKAKKAAE